MDEFESIRQKLKELQTSLINPGAESYSSPIESISVADFWKKKYDQEKKLWEQKLTVKGQEQEEVLSRAEQNEDNIREMQFKIRALEEKLQVEKTVWEERSKTKTVEGDLEKKKIEWDSKLRLLEEENENLRYKIRQGVELTDEESRRRQLIETEKIQMEETIRELQFKIQTSELEGKRKLLDLEAERRELEKSLEALTSKEKESAGRCAEIEKELAQIAQERDKHLAFLEERENDQLQTFEEMSRGFAHRVRNYLGILNGTFQLCNTNFKMDEPLKKELGMIGESGKEMLGIIDEFLAISKVPAVALHPANANEIMVSVCYSLEDAAKKHDVKLDQRPAESLPPIAADTGILSEALRHIIQNAIEASAAGKTVSISTEFDKDSNHVLIRVADSGSGIPEALIKRVFQPYFTTRKNKKGLGLTIAKRGVFLHHGWLTLSSARDQGTTALVRLPAHS